MFLIENTVLLVIDVQGTLAHQMVESNDLFRNIEICIQLAKVLDIPILCSEEAPDKIGATIPEIAKYLTGIPVITKSSFSCLGEPHFTEQLKLLNRKQIIIIGIETHVCVFQTACDLIENGYEVQVVDDAVSSRLENNKNVAINRMKSLGIAITTLEMIATELLRTSKHKKFKEVLRLIK